jgi:hypothetical protein
VFNSKYPAKVSSHYNKKQKKRMVSKKQYYSRFKNSFDEQLTLVRELPISQVKNHIEPKLHDLANEYEGDEILIKILVIGNFNEIFLKKLSTLLNIYLTADEQLNLQQSARPLKVGYELDGLTIHAVFYSEKSLLFNYEGLFEGHLGIVTFGEEADINAKNLELVKHIFGQHGYLWLCKDQAAKSMPVTCRDDILATDWIDYEGETATLSQYLKRPDFLQKLAITQTYNSLLTIDTLSQATTRFVRQTEKQNRIQKLSLPVQNTSYGSKTNIETDVYGQIKNSVQQQLSLLEKRVQDSFELFVLPGTGAFWAKVFPAIDTLNDLETIEKAKTNILKINDKVQETYLAYTRKVLSDQFVGAMRLTNDALNSLEKEVVRTCQQKGVPVVSLFMNYLNDKELSLTLDSSIRIERPYEAAVQRKGFYEYFMAVRKYQMIFLMFISLFGIGSYIRRQPKIMITATLILTAFGAYTLRKTVKQERQEQTDKEVERAREMLRDETKRMSSETLQRWRKQLSDYFKTLNVQIMRQIDESTQIYQQRRQVQMEDEKRTFQRISQGFDVVEKQLSGFQRSQDMWIRNQQRLKAELKSEFLRIR